MSEQIDPRPNSLTEEEHRESGPTGSPGYELDWDKLPYPLWLRNWMDREMTRIIKAGETPLHTKARTLARKRIEEEFNESGIPTEFLEDNQPKGTAAFLIGESMRDAKEADPVFPAEPD